MLPHTSNNSYVLNIDCYAKNYVIFDLKYCVQIFDFHFFFPPSNIIRIECYSIRMLDNNLFYFDDTCSNRIHCLPMRSLASNIAIYVDSHNIIVVTEC